MENPTSPRRTNKPSSLAAAAAWSTRRRLTVPSPTSPLQSTLSAESAQSDVGKRANSAPRATPSRGAPPESHHQLLSVATTAATTSHHHHHQHSNPSPRRGTRLQAERMKSIRKTRTSSPRVRISMTTSSQTTSEEKNLLHTSDSSGGPSRHQHRHQQAEYPTSPQSEYSSSHPPNTDPSALQSLGSSYSVSMYSMSQPTEDDDEEDDYGESHTMSSRSRPGTIQDESLTVSPRDGAGTTFSSSRDDYDDDDDEEEEDEEEDDYDEVDGTFTASPQTTNITSYTESLLSSRSHESSRKVRTRQSPPQKERTATRRLKSPPPPLSTGAVSEEDVWLQRNSTDGVASAAAPCSPTSLQLLQLAGAATSPLQPSSSQPRRQKQRIPGGAAAKLMLLGPKGSSVTPSSEEANEGEEEDPVDGCGVVGANFHRDFEKEFAHDRHLKTEGLARADDYDNRGPGRSPVKRNSPSKAHGSAAAEHIKNLTLQMLGSQDSYVNEEKLKDIDREMRQVKEQFYLRGGRTTGPPNVATPMILTATDTAAATMSSTPRARTSREGPFDEDSPRDHDNQYQQQHHYHKEQYQYPDNARSEVNTPSFLTPSKIFHETAAAAILALLSPRNHANPHGTIVEMADSQSHVSSSVVASDFPDGQSVMSSGAFHVPRSEAGLANESYVDQYPHKYQVSPTLLSPETEKKLEEMRSKMHAPTTTLTELLTAIATPDDHEKASTAGATASTVPTGTVAPASVQSSLFPENDLGFMVRRKNACGALQVLTANEANRIRICWTLGVLPALASVLNDAADDGSVAAFPDKRIRTEYVEARIRAIASIMNLSLAKSNRLAIFHTPDLIKGVLATIRDDQGTSRRGCCAILASLAKSPENRLLMGQVPGLIDAVEEVLRPLPPRPLASPASAPPSESKKEYPWSSSDLSDDSESQTSDQDESTKASIQMSPKVAGENGHAPAATRGEEQQSAAAKEKEGTGYDAGVDEYLRGARQNVFALMGHLCKEKDNAFHFAREPALVNTMVSISKFHDNPMHELAVRFLASLTRHRSNTKTLVFRHRELVVSMVMATESMNDQTRLLACRALQNMAQDKSCRQELATTHRLLPALCDRARKAKIDDERLAAVSTLKNLCDEPANLIPMTNTPECVATLMHLAHGKEAGVTPMMQYRACDALATLSHWMRKIATSGQSLDATKHGRPAVKGLFVPSLQVVTWNQWQ